MAALLHPPRAFVALLRLCNYLYIGATSLLSDTPPRAGVVAFSVIAASGSLFGMRLFLTAGGIEPPAGLVDRRAARRGSSCLTRLIFAWLYQPRLPRRLRVTRQPPVTYHDEAFYLC